MIDEDSTALRLYDKGKINFLRRLVTTEISAHKNGKDFYQIPMARFDYIGFGPSLSQQPVLRKALALALDYDRLKDLYFALGRPGCPSLPKDFYSGDKCIPFDPEQAKKLFASLPEEIRKKPLTLAFSRQGGDDISRGMEWIQGQWKKHLSLDVHLRPYEQGMYLQELKFNPPDVFRKGVAIDRPTCLAALENFSHQASENYIRFKNSKMEKLLQDMNLTNDSQAKRQLCSQGIDLLMQEHWLIPLGEMHFTVLAQPKFIGWFLTPMNQLDLTDLELTK